MSHHYQAHPSGVEVIEITQYESFLRGNIIKYIMRAPYKGTELEDLEKAAQYLQWEIERVKEEQFWAEEQEESFDWQEVYKRRAKVNEDYYDYYRAGIISGKTFDEIVFADKCQECDGSCKVCG